jgi:hypothetical protein
MRRAWKNYRVQNTAVHRQRSFEQRYSLEEAVRDGSMNWIVAAFNSVHNDDCSVETWDVLMNYMALEGTENLWKKGEMLKQVAYSPNGEGGCKAQQPTNSMPQESQGGNRLGRNDFGKGFPSKPSGYGEDCNNSGGGGNPNPRFRNFGSGFKRGDDDSGRAWSLSGQGSMGTPLSMGVRSRPAPKPR